MDVKVLCQCGAKFQFEIEPVNGRMPCAIACPSCGADATERANVVIAEKFASMPAQPPPPPPAPVAVAHAVHVAHPAAVAAPEEAGIPYCPKHRDEIAVAECFVCQKPICTKCMELFGYLCSSYCKGQAQARKLIVPVYAGQASERVKKEGRGQSFILIGSAALVALLLGSYIYYWFVLSKPRTAFKVETGPGSPFLASGWIGEDRVFGVTPSRLTMYNAADGAELWNVDIPAGEIKGHKDKHDEWDFDFEPVVKTVAKDIWIGLPNRVLRVDGQTGKKKQELALSQPASVFEMSDDALLAVSVNSTNDSKLLTRIDLASGQLVYDVTPATTGARRIAGITRDMPGLQNTSIKQMDRTDEDFAEFSSTEYRLDPDYVFTGANVAHLTRRLLEARIETRPSTKPLDGPMLIDKQSLRASQGMAAAEEFVNQGQPDTKIDQSLYLVTIRRYFGGGAEWSGQVTGRPYFFSQKTVDYLVAGNTLIVFNKNNQKLWEAKLTYGISPNFWEEHDEAGPAREMGNRFLFWDQGVLTCFDLKKGDAQWRVNSVGISSVAPDSDGNLYVSSTTASPDQIKYGKQISFANMIYPMIVKVEMKSGKVVWQAGRVGINPMVNGGIIYTTYAQVSGAEMISAASVGESAATHWRIFRIDPSNGKDLWEHHRVGVPQGIYPKQKRILLQYRDHLRLLKYM